MEKGWRAVFDVKKLRGDKKKYIAIFSDGTKIKFGAAGYMDYIKYYKKDPKEAERKKEAYLKRHSATENWNNIKTAGALSRWILWNKPTLEESIKDTKKRFNL